MKQYQNNAGCRKHLIQIMALVVVLVGMLSSYANAQKCNLTVNVTNFKKDKGYCQYSLFNSANGFLDDKKALKIVNIPVVGTSGQYVFQDLPPGTYAVTVWQDENNNHKFDTNFLGIPKERYGNSNNIRGGITGPPKFDKCSFVLDKDGTTVSIKIE